MKGRHPDLPHVLGTATFAAMVHQRDLERRGADVTVDG